jgi:hypothetical protein
VSSRLWTGRVQVRILPPGPIKPVSTEEKGQRVGEVARAANLLETITPFFDRLHFHPVPHVRPLRQRGSDARDIDEQPRAQTGSCKSVQYMLDSRKHGNQSGRAST